MTLLMIGSGDARDHATFDRLAREGNRVRYGLFGRNAILMREAGVTILPSLDAALSLVCQPDIELVVVQQPELLIAGVADRFREAGARVVGASTRHAELEGSKRRCKEFLAASRVPSPDWVPVSSLAEAEAFLRRQWVDGEREYVVKSDRFLRDASLRSAVPTSLKEALDYAARLIQVPASKRGSEILLEEKVWGSELSLHLLLDGQIDELCPVVSDYKRLLDGDRGPNTHGMGAVAAGWWPPWVHARLVEEIVRPLLSGFRAHGLDYRGVLTVGVLWTEHGPAVLELNIRPGNPEWVALLALLQSSLTATLHAFVDSTLADALPRWRQAVTGCVYVTAPGYPYPSAPSEVAVLGLDRLPDGIRVFGEGIRGDADCLHVGEGRSFCLVAEGDTVGAMRNKLYDALKQVAAEGTHIRRDIGLYRPLVMTNDGEQ